MYRAFSPSYSGRSFCLTPSATGAWRPYDAMGVAILMIVILVCRLFLGLEVVDVLAMQRSSGGLLASQESRLP